MSEPTRRRLFEGAAGVVVEQTERRREPSFVHLERSGELEERARALHSFYRACRLCPRACGANRLQGKKGVCQGGARARVSAAHPHFGEERPLVGSGGSGTIFFSKCNLRCGFCQNWEIADGGAGEVITDQALARMMLSLQDRGCHNINLVTPTHFVPSIVAALVIAVRSGLRLPLVYNCSGYEPAEILRLLDGIIDIYLPDFKYMDGAVAAKYSAGAKDYPAVAAAAIKEMHRQVGELVVDEDGVALRGLMVRHLVLPENLAGTDRFVKWVATNLTPTTYVNLMAQYHPAHHAFRFSELSRRITPEEYRRALDWAREAGLTRLTTS